MSDADCTPGREPRSVAASDIFNMSCLGVILRYGMSTAQNGAAAYSQSHISRICQGRFPLSSLPFSSSIQQYALQKNRTATW